MSLFYDSPCGKCKTFHFFWYGIAIHIVINDIHKHCAQYNMIWPKMQVFYIKWMVFNFNNLNNPNWQVRQRKY
jgi:hypothetical protein